MMPLVCTILLISALSVDCRILHRPQQESTPSPPSPLQTLPVIFNVQAPSVILDSLQFNGTEELAEEADKKTLSGFHMVDDMMLTEEQWSALRERKAIKDVAKRWPEDPMTRYPIVHYAFQSREHSGCINYNPADCNTLNGLKVYCRVLCNTGFRAFATSKNSIMAAIKYWQDHTCIVFKKVAQDAISTPYILFSGVSDGCSSPVGRINMRGGQLVHTVGCQVGSIIHEIGHSIGFFHEQSRSDRDDYVIVLETNAKPNARNNFQLAIDNNYSIPYDYSSLMHYGPTYFTEFGQPTILTKSPTDLEIIGKRHKLSHRDKLLANTMYECTDKWLAKNGLSANKCKHDGYIGRTGTCICPPGTSGSLCEDVVGNYYDEARDKRSELISTAKRISVETPMEPYTSFLKSVIPPKCKIAKVTFISSNMFADCKFQSLHITTSENDATGKLYCAADVKKAIGNTIESEEGIFITMINLVNYTSIITLLEADVTFDDRPSCCTNIFTYNLQPWTDMNMQKISGWMKIPFQSKEASWKIDLTFDQDIEDFIIWNLKKVVISATTVTLSPYSWTMNAVQSNGILSVDFQIVFTSKDTPKIISAKLNGEEQCQ